MTSAEYRTLVAGVAQGPLLALSEPLSLWGGLDPDSGMIIDRSHPEGGQRVSGRVLYMSHGRGSSSSSSVLAEAIRLGTAPSAIITSDIDSILMTGAMVASLLYGRSCPVLCGPKPTGEWDEIDESGTVKVR
ncbi:MAG: DUF126 domain-containing protein [Acidimicrobiia bacterium]